MASQQAAVMQQVLNDKLLEVAKVVEEQLDAQMEEMDRLDEDDIETIRQKRIAQMKKAASKKEEWLANGHGVYTEVADEKEFFAETKKSKRNVVHFYRDGTFRCKIVDKHLNILAQTHLETRFLKINVERAPFLCQRLNIKTLPTMLMIKDEKTIGRLIGFSALGETDEFSTEMLEWVFGGHEIISYSGDLSKPPDNMKTNSDKSAVTVINKKSIRGKDDDNSDDDWWSLFFPRIFDTFFSYLR